MEIRKTIEASMAVKQRMLDDRDLQQAIMRAAGQMAEVFRKGGKVLLCGNGGSAADAQHIAAELSGRFCRDRKPLYAEALHVNSSYVTAVANDYSFDEIYARMIEAAGNKGDLLIGISTSGNSENVLRAMQKANEIGMFTIGMSGQNGGKLSELVDLLINVPAEETPRIQEAHGLIGHILCQGIEEDLFPEKNYG